MKCTCKYNYNMLLQIIGFAIGFCLPSWFSKKRQTIKYEEEREQMHRFCEMEQRNKRMYKASDYLKEMENKGELYCLQNDKTCKKLLEQYRKGSVNSGLDDWHDIVVPLSEKVRVR